jgi:hypothetical protein
MDIIKNLAGISYVEFRKEDIVRSRFVSDYIIEKERFESEIKRVSVD